jgi:hypothetical protein
MIIINATLDGENTYDITVSETNTYRVSAFTLEDALDRVADYIEGHNEKGIGFLADTLELIAKLSGYTNVKEFATFKGLKQYGTNGIYLEITNVKGCPNG